MNFLIRILICCPWHRHPFSVLTRDSWPPTVISLCSEQGGFRVWQAGPRRLPTNGHGGTLQLESLETVQKLGPAKKSFGYFKDFGGNLYEVASFPVDPFYHYNLAVLCTFNLARLFF